MRRAAEWIIDGLGLQALIDFVRTHNVPRGIGTRAGWLYVFGFATLAAFLLQVITGIGLATLYVPSAEDAHASLVYITGEVGFGALLRAIHYFGASAMVVLIGVHALRVFLTASYKYPRHFNWIFGVLLLGLTMVMALTGQLLRWDENGLWTVVVAAKFAVRVPLIGPYLAELILAGPTVGGMTLSRFFTLHAIVLPLLMAALIAVHLYLVIQNGISEPPHRGRAVERETYRSWYARQKARGIPYWPGQAARESLVAGITILVVLVLAVGFGPKGPGEPPDPTVVVADPRPDWYLRWYYALLWIKPRGLEAFTMVYAPLLVLAGLILLPILFPAGERSLIRRPWALAFAGLLLTALAALTAIGLRVPWTPVESEPLGPAALGVETGPVLAGAQVFHAKGCPYCHIALGEGGRYGPDLTRVAARMSPEEITVRIVMGYRDMPPYRDALSFEELDAILVFLRALPERAATAGRG